MQCVICKSEVKQGTTTLTFQKNGSTVVFKNVPALVCTNCGEAYVDDKTAEHLLTQVETESRKGIELEVLYYSNNLQPATS